MTETLNRTAHYPLSLSQFPSFSAALLQESPELNASDLWILAHKSVHCLLMLSAPLLSLSFPLTQPVEADGCPTLAWLCQGFLLRKGSFSSPPMPSAFSGVKSPSLTYHVKCHETTRDYIVL